MIEIERKFLVKSDIFKSESFKVTRIVQAYLCSQPERSVRVRIKGERAFLTVKGASDENGFSRFEWEKEIALEEATALLTLCEPIVIEKMRYEVCAGRHIYEVDVFESENAGLTVAEIELAAVDETFEKPAWLGAEVTGDPRYYNASLSKKPFKMW